MRILHVIANVDPHDGGPINGLKMAATVMAQSGHETEIVSLDRETDPYHERFPFKVYPQGSWVRRYGYTPKLAQWIARNAHRYDAAVVHGLWNHAAIGGGMALRKAGLPYVVFVHGMLAPWFRDAYPLKHMAKQIFWLAAQGKVLRDARYCLFTSEEERLQARDVFFGYRYKERVVAYGTQEPPPVMDRDATAFRALLPGLGQKRYLLFLSRIHRKKGCDLLIDAFSRIAPAYPDVDLVIAGPAAPPLREQLQKQARDSGIESRVHWPGMLDGDVKWQAFYKADAFVLPSHQENFGIAIAEAMACGVPVLTSDKVNIWREIEKSGGGLIQPDTAEGAYNLLKSWLSLSPAQQDEMRRSARRGYEKYFHIESAAADLTRVLEEIKKGTPA